MDSITRFQIKGTEDEYLVKDSKAIKSIECIYSGNKREELFPDNNGKLSIKIPAITRASNKNLGGVLIGADENLTNIHLDQDGYIYAILPIRKICDADGIEIKTKSEEDNTMLKMPKATTANYGLVKTGENIYLDNFGQLAFKFGESGDIFNNVKEEKEYINFNLEDFMEEDDGTEI